MSRIALIILYPLNLRKFDLERWEIKFLQKIFYLEIHEFHNLLNPNFVNAHKSEIVKNKKIFSFNSINYWKKHILSLKKNHNKIIVLNLLMKDKFYRIFILLILKKVKIPRIDINIQSLPLLNDINKNLFKKYYNKIKNITSKPSIYFAVIAYKIKVVDFLIKLLDLGPNFILIAGRKNLINNNIYKNKKIIIKNFSTADRSRYLRQFNCKKIIKGNYSVFLGEPGPYDPGDDLYLNIKSKLDHIYYNCLNNFFSNFEKVNNTKVVIASHPKAIAEKDSEYFNNRSAFYNKTNQLVKNCKFVICFNSVSLSYALLHKKPVCFIYNSKLKFNKSSSSIKQIKLLHKLIGGKLIDIDYYKKNDLFFMSNSIILNKYNQFIKNYISCRNDNKTNYQIIEELIKKNQYLLWK
jgi:hypothetical protein